ncbi:MAG: UDP-2,3-diacylglucosamine diphosphatase LpxI [Planctomycetota bacterium]|nr:UDP-2,3-diacylglucosamine diphosphatase LpxI [Planctomycetota bacterium]
MRGGIQLASHTAHSAGFHQPGTRIGLVAGWGRFPIVLAETLRESGYPIYCLGVKDHADPVLQSICTDFKWIGLAKLGGSIRYFKRNGVTAATMAGKIHKVRLYQRWAWLKHLPDWAALKTFYPHFIASKKDRRDDTLLTAIVDAFSTAGITFGPATDYAPELLVKFGQLTQRGPSTAQLKDIELGWTLAKEMGRLDVGQSVVVKDRTPIAIEAIEGTDECIRRAGQLCRAGGFTVVKTAKPQQDMRFDVPTIGLGTLETMLATGGKLLAVEANRTILVDQQQCIDFANQHGLIVVALDHAGAFAS